MTLESAASMLARLLADTTGRPASDFVSKATQLIGEIEDDAIREAKSCATCECIDESKAEDVCRDYCDDAIDEAVKKAMGQHLETYHRRDERQLDLFGVAPEAARDA